jgi:hypothetical protein
MLSENKAGRVINASILYEMPQEEGNEQNKGSYDEERQARNPGRLSYVRDQNVPHWKRLINHREFIKKSQLGLMT